MIYDKVMFEQSSTYDVVKSPPVSAIQIIIAINNSVMNQRVNQDVISIVLSDKLS